MNDIDISIIDTDMSVMSGINSLESGLSLDDENFVDSTREEDW